VRILSKYDLPGDEVPVVPWFGAGCVERREEVEARSDERMDAVDRI